MTFAANVARNSKVSGNVPWTEGDAAITKAGFPNAGQEYPWRKFPF